MAYRMDEFTPGEIYHVFSQGVEKRRIYLSTVDKKRFVDLLIHCLPPGGIPSFSTARKLKYPLSPTHASEGLADLLCYCLMGNHFHLLLKENTDKGISLFMMRLLNSYASYFNRKQERSGPLFIHPFKGVLISNDEQFLHVSRYIHLNPYAARHTDTPLDSPWSSLSEYIYKDIDGICHQQLLLSLMGSQEYKSFVSDHADYARSIKDIQYQLIDT